MFLLGMCVAAVANRTPAGTGNDWLSLGRGLLADVTFILLVASWANHFPNSTIWASPPEFSAGQPRLSIYYFGRFTTPVLVAIFLYGASAGPSKSSGLIARALSHPVLVGISDYAFSVYLWATPIACLMAVHFTHSDPLIVTPNDPHASDLADSSAPDHPYAGARSQLDKTDVPALHAWVLLVHVFAVAYTDLFEASVFGSDGGPIRALVKRAMDGASSLLPAPARAAGKTA